MSATVLPKPPEAASTALGSEVYRGLTSSPKTLSPWLFYDSAGSALFEEITELPEYYPTRTERSILAGHAEEIVAAAAGDRRLTMLELGAGTATKTGLLLKAAVERQGAITYYAIDVSHTALAEAKTRLESELPGVRVEPIVADYTDGFEQIRLSNAGGFARRLVLYIGSSIGNFSPEQALDLLRQVRAQLGSGDGLLLGVDMVKDERLLLAAYNDSAGVTADFNKNVLTRINRELGANFDLNLFSHKAIWSPCHSRVEMHLESLVAQRVSIAELGLDLCFARGETIHTENSYKFTRQRAAAMLAQAGFKIRGRWTNPRQWFSVYLAGAE